MTKWVVICMAALALAGCGSKPAPKPVAAAAAKPKGPPADPDQALYEEVRAGVYQINYAMDQIEAARKTTKDMAGREQGNTKTALLSIATTLDDAGGTLSDYADDPPPISEFHAHFATQDDNRLKAIQAGNEALEALHDAEDLLGTLIDSKPPEPEKTQLNDAATALDGCIGAVEDAIKMMGGKVQAPAVTPQ